MAVKIVIINSIAEEGKYGLKKLADNLSGEERRKRFEELKTKI